MSQKYIYIACGGSGGHIMPGLGLCNILAKLPYVNIVLIGVDRKENKRFFDNYISNIPYENVEYFLLPDVRIKDLTPFSKTVPLNFLKYMIKLVLSVWWISKLFSKKRPVLVMGFGSYAAFPVVFLATLFKSIFTVIHEQNLTFGKANQLLILVVDKITISFYESIKYLKKISKDLKFKIYYKVNYFLTHKSSIEEKVLFTGNPSVFRKEASLPKRKINLESKKNINILVTGGSQGSDFLNYIVPKAIGKMRKSLLQKVKVIHIIGERERERIESEYKKTKVTYKIINFNFNMCNIYKVSDLAICRAGATTLSEIIFYKLPSILIPFKFVRSHQVDNATLFRKLKAAIILEEDECDENKLVHNIEKLLEDSSLRKQIVGNLKNLQQVDTERKFMEIVKEAGIETE